MAGPSSLEEGSPYHLVTPRVQRDGRIFRPAVLVASALALACVVAAVASSGASRSVLQAVPGQSSEVPLEMMPDPAEAGDETGESASEVVEIVPAGGTLVVFDSRSMLHAVTPSLKPRIALTAWLEHVSARYASSKSNSLLALA